MAGERGIGPACHPQLLKQFWLARPVVVLYDLNAGYMANNTTKNPFNNVRVRRANNVVISKKPSSTVCTWAPV